MTRRARLYAQLAFVADNDAAALLHEYAWPPVQPSADEVEQAEHLRDVGEQLFARARGLGFVGGTDAAFGEQE